MEVKKDKFEQAQQLNDYKSALLIIEEIIQDIQCQGMKPNEELLVNYADALGGIGDLDKAKTLYELIEDNFGKSVRTHFGLYRVAYKNEEFELAHQMIPFLMRNITCGHQRNELNKNLAFLKTLRGDKVAYCNNLQRKIIAYTKNYNKDSIIRDILVDYTNEIGMSQKGNGFILFNNEHSKNMEELFEFVSSEVAAMPKDRSTDPYNLIFPTFDTYYVSVPNCGINANAEPCDKIKVQTLPHSKQPFDMFPTK